MTEKELLTADEAAQKLSVTRRTILKWAREKRIESIGISRKKILFSREAIDEFLRSKTHKVESPSITHQGAGRNSAPPKPKEGGNKRSTGKLWNDLRKEVASWQ